MSGKKHPFLLLISLSTFHLSTCLSVKPPQATIHLIHTQEIHQNNPPQEKHLRQEEIGAETKMTPLGMQDLKETVKKLEIRENNKEKLDETGKEIETGTKIEPLGIPALNETPKIKEKNMNNEEKRNETGKETHKKQEIRENNEEKRNETGKEIETGTKIVPLGIPALNETVKKREKYMNEQEKLNETGKETLKKQEIPINEERKRNETGKETQKKQEIREHNEEKLNETGKEIETGTKMIPLGMPALNETLKKREKHMNNEEKRNKTGKETLKKQEIPINEGKKRNETGKETEPGTKIEPLEMPTLKDKRKIKEKRENNEEKRNKTGKETLKKQEKQINKQDKLNKTGTENGVGTKMAPLETPLNLTFLDFPDEDRREEEDKLRQEYYRPHTRPRHASTPMERNVGVGDVTPWNILHIVTTSPPPPPPPAASCSSLTCLWFHSWQFILISCMTGLWVVALTSLFVMVRTSTGRYILDSIATSCSLKASDDDPVETKGIGYFDGSPGMRRFVVIEEDREEDEEPIEDLSTDGKVLDRPKAWRPPRKGTYILQEANKDVLELGRCYRRQEEDVIEDQDEVEYVLEGPTYILQSERVGLGNEGGDSEEEMNGRYRIIGGEGGGGRGEIEGLYGIIKQGRGIEEGIGGRGNSVILSVNNLKKNIGPTNSFESNLSREYTRERGLGGGLEGAVGGENARSRSRSTLPYKRSASFPMDNYSPVHLLSPRKLSLIKEEEMHG